MLPTGMSCDSLSLQATIGIVNDMACRIHQHRLLLSLILKRKETIATFVRKIGQHHDIGSDDSFEIIHLLIVGNAGFDNRQLSRLIEFP